MPPPLDFKLLATSALAFGGALAWNNAVEAAIRGLYPEGTRQSAHATLVYAVVVTIAIILIVVLINGAFRVVERFHLRRLPLRGGAAASSAPPPEGAPPPGGAAPPPPAGAQMVNISWPRHWL